MPLHRVEGGPESSSAARRTRHRQRGRLDAYSVPVSGNDDAEVIANLGGRGAADPLERVESGELAAGLRRSSKKESLTKACVDGVNGHPAATGAPFTCGITSVCFSRYGNLSVIPAITRYTSGFSQSCTISSVVWPGTSSWGRVAACRW